MLPKKNRLKKKKDFEKVFKKGKGTKESFLFFKWVFNNLKISRFGFVVNQKVSKKAVLRNKVKRRLRELIKLKLPEIKNGIDGVFVAQPGLEKKDYKQIEDVLSKILPKAKVLK